MNENIKDKITEINASVKKVMNLCTEFKELFGINVIEDGFHRVNPWESDSAVSWHIHEGIDVLADDLGCELFVKKIGDGTDEYANYKIFFEYGGTLYFQLERKKERVEEMTGKQADA